MDEPISRLVGSSRDMSRAWRLPEFSFQHAFALLPTLEELRTLRGVDNTGTVDDDDTHLMAGEAPPVPSQRNHFFFLVVGGQWM